MMLTINPQMDFELFLTVRAVIIFHADGIHGPMFAKHHWPPSWPLQATNCVNLVATPAGDSNSPNVSRIRWPKRKRGIDKHLGVDHQAWHGYHHHNPHEGNVLAAPVSEANTAG